MDTNSESITIPGNSLAKGNNKVPAGGTRSPQKQAGRIRNGPSIPNYIWITTAIALTMIVGAWVWSSSGYGGLTEPKLIKPTEPALDSSTAGVNPPDSPVPLPDYNLPTAGDPSASRAYVHPIDPEYSAITGPPTQARVTKQAKLESDQGNLQQQRVARAAETAEIRKMFPVGNIANRYTARSQQSRASSEELEVSVEYDGKTWSSTGRYVDSEQIEVEPTGVHQNGCDIYTLTNGRASDSVIFLRNPNDRGRYIIYRPQS